MILIPVVLVDEQKVVHLDFVDLPGSTATIAT